MLKRSEALALLAALGASAMPRSAEAAATFAGNPPPNGLVPSDILDFGASPKFVRIDEHSQYAGAAGGLFRPTTRLSSQYMADMLGSATHPNVSTNAKITVTPGYFNPSSTKFVNGNDFAVLQIALNQKSPLSEFDPTTQQLLSWTSVWSLIKHKGQKLTGGEITYGGVQNAKRFGSLPFNSAFAEISTSLLWGNDNSNVADTITTVFQDLNQVTTSAAFGALLALPAVDVSVAANVQSLIMGLLPFTKHPVAQYEFGTGTVPVCFHASGLPGGFTTFGQVNFPVGESFWLAVRPAEYQAFEAVCNGLAAKSQKIALDAGQNGKPVVQNQFGGTVSNTAFDEFTTVSYQVNVVGVP